MPDGLRLFTSTTVSPNPINHNFIVIRQDATRIYGTALLFAEEIENEDIKLAVTDLQNMFRIAHNTIDGRHSFCSECNKGSPDILNGNIQDSSWLNCQQTSFSGRPNEQFWMEDEKLYTLKVSSTITTL